MTTENPNLAKLLEQVANLDIEVSVSSEGVYNACSTSEPHFCFEGHTQAEVADRVVEAIESYARVYFGLTDFKFRSSRRDAPEESVKVEAPRTVSRLALEAA